MEMRAIDFAWTCAVAAIVISLAHIFAHLWHYHEPATQRRVVRILLMVPMFALQALLTLTVSGAWLYADLVRDIYEAYVIYAFLSLLIEYLGGEEQLLEVLHRKPRVAHPWPFDACLPPMAAARDPDLFLRRVRQGVLQFTATKPLTALATVVFSVTGSYEEGSFSLNSPYLWLSIANNISVSVSLYSLAVFYVATKHELRPFDPFAKFLCIKAVVFLTFWQDFFLTLASRLGWVDREVGLYLNDYLICVEMLLAAIAHRVVFDYPRHPEIPLPRAVLRKANAHQRYGSTHERSPLLQPEDKSPATAPAALEPASRTSRSNATHSDSGRGRERSRLMQLRLSARQHLALTGAKDVFQLRDVIDDTLVSFKPRKLKSASELSHLSSESRQNAQQAQRANATVSEYAVGAEQLQQREADIDSGGSASVSLQSSKSRDTVSVVTV